MTRVPRRQSRAFSLIELVIVITILGIIAGIALTRMSRGTEGAASSALAEDLGVLRKAVDLYQGEHDGLYPTDPANQLTKYTDGFGNVSPTQDTAHTLGPYLRSVPSLPVGAARGSLGIGSAGSAGIGWVYDSSSGNISANTTASEVDGSGKPYNTY